MNAIKGTTDDGAQPEHSPVGPSSLSATILCPGRVAMQDGQPDHTSFVAAEGTVAHQIGEERLNGKPGYSLGQVVEQDGYQITVGQDMLDAVTVYLDTINEIRQAHKDMASIELIEGKVAVPGVPECYGTADYVLAVPFYRLTVVDYKHGQGVLVSPENSAQGMAYALGAAGDMLETYQEVEIVIVQPRGKGGEQVKRWITSPEQLLTWRDDVLAPAAAAAMECELGEGLNPGEQQCRWCSGSGRCPALADMALVAAQEDFAGVVSNLDPTEPSTFSAAQLAEAYEKLPLIKTWVKAVEGRAYDEAVINNLPGYKIVKGRRSRKWKDEAVAAGMLGQLVGDAAYKPSSLISPAQAEKLLKGGDKKKLKELIAVSDGKPVVVAESDNREAVNMIAEEFKKEK